MVNKKSTNDLRTRFLWFATSIGILSIVLFSLVSDTTVASRPNDLTVPASVLDRADLTTRNSILRAATQGFQPSLEMKENVDFLLTPALLVQQAMSDDVTVTYPSE